MNLNNMLPALFSSKTRTPNHQVILAPKRHKRLKKEKVFPAEVFAPFVPLWG